jgi:hypothetical protein
MLLKWQGFLTGQLTFNLSPKNYVVLHVLCDFYAHDKYIIAFDTFIQ